MSQMEQHTLSDAKNVDKYETPFSVKANVIC